MPDFNKDLTPKITPIQTDKIDFTQRAINAPQQTSSLPTYAGTDDVMERLKKASAASNPTEKGVYVSNAELEANKRYREYNPTIPNYEDFAAYGQSVADKAANGLLKGLNLAGTTMAGSFGMIYGAVKSPFSGRLADLWDNEATRALDDWNTKVDQELLPNYYTDAEKNAAWYSTDNWFKTNFLFDKLIKNSGFAVGAMATGNLANTGLLKAGQALGKAAMAGATAAETSQAFKLFTPLLRNTARAFSNAQNIEAAAILEKEISSIGDLAARTSKLGELAKKTNTIANIGNTGRRTAIAAYSSAGEASFEALGTAKEFREKLIKDYTDLNGKEPDADALKDINAKADKMGKASFLGNLAILSATEYVQLPKLLGSNYSASKQAANSLLGKADDVVLKDGVYVAKTAATKFGRISDKVTGAGKYVYDPKEALQEGLQYALQVGTQNYYNKAFQSKNADALVDGFLYGLFGTDKYGEGVGALVSKEGIESMVLGGITGGAMQIGGNIREARELKTNTASFLQELNSTPAFKQSFVDRMNSINRANVLQQQQQEAVIQGDKLEAKDIDADLMHNYLASRIKYGRFDMVKDDINDLRSESTTEQGLSSLKEQGVANINDTIQSFQARLATFEKVADYTNELYKSLDLRYSGVLTEEGNKKYSPEVIDKMVYAAAKVANYDLRIPQVNDSLVSVGVNTGDILESIIKTFKPNKEATEKAIEQINELDVTSDIKDELKTNLSDVIEMSLRRKLFMQEYDDIKDNPKNYELKPEVEFGAEEQLPVTVEQKEPGKKKPVEKELEIGKEYSLKETSLRTGNTLQLAPKISVLSQTLGGEYEVKLPNGEVSFLSPEQFKQYQIADVENDSEELKTIMDKSINSVLGKKAFNDIVVPEGQDPLEYINSLDNASLIDAVAAEFKKNAKDFLAQQANAQARREKMNQYAEQLKKTQEAIQGNSGTVATGAAAVDLANTPKETRESMLKAFQRLFTATVSDSIDWAAKEGRTLAPHVTYFNQFINNVKNFKNRKSIKAILVTPTQQEALGLSGLAEMSFRAGNLDVSTINDPKIGFVGAVFISVDKKGNKEFIDKDGNVIGKVGQPVDINKVVFSTMPSTSLYNSKGGERFRGNEKEEAALESAAWEAYRERLFNGTETNTMFDFGVSKGIAITGETNNSIGGILIPENKISTQQVVQVVTKGSITHEDGNNYKFPNGRPVFQYGDTLEFLNNDTFNEKQATAIYKVLKALSDSANKQTTLNPKYLTFLQNVLFWDVTGKTPESNNKIYIDGSVLHIGQNTYDFANIANQEAKVINDLQTVYHNVNNKTLLAGLGEPFIEFYVDSNKELQERTWKNYQSYLLASKNPDGSNRVSPLTTNVVAPTEAVPYTHKQKYAYMMAMELPRQTIVKTEVPKTEVKIYPANSGPISYTTSVDTKGRTNVILSEDNPTIEKMANDPAMVAVIVDALKNAGKFKEGDTTLQQTADFVKLTIEAGLNKEQVTTEEEAPKDVVKTITRKSKSDNPEYRRVGKTNVRRITAVDLEAFKAWAAEKVPGIPYEFLDNLIDTYDGEKAWGVFENGVAKIFKNAQRGTEYHEIGEGIWKGFLSPEQQEALINEFKANKGTFKDRQSGKKIDYSEATDQQAKERIMDDLGDYILGTLPARNLGEKIARFFKAVVNFFKSFVQKPSLKEEFFKAVAAGEFADRVFPESKKNDAAEYKKINGINAQQTHEFVQDITARIFQRVFSNNESLFNIENITAKEIFDDINAEYIEDGVIGDNPDEQISQEIYNQLVENVKTFLKTYSIEFDEDSRISINDANKDSRGYAAEAFTVNFKKSSPYAVKLLIGTLIQTKGLNQQNATTLVMPEAALSSVDGYKLVPFSRAWTILSNTLSNTIDVPTFVNKLYNLAKENSDYMRLFKRLGGNIQTGQIDFNSFKPYDMRLFINFYQTFTKQKPEVLAQFVDGNKVYVAPANQASLINQVVGEWTETMKAKANQPGSIITFADRKYNVEKGDYKIGNPKEMLDFLGKLGIDISMADYNKIKNKKAFADAVSGIKIGINKSGELMTLTGKLLDIEGSLKEISRLYVSATAPAEDSTYFNIEGNRQQLYTDSNAPSYIESVFNSADTLEELKQMLPQLNDVFSTNSQILKLGGKFFNEEGDRIAELKVLTIQGNKNLNKNAGQTVTSLSIGNRTVTEINQNIDGNYYVLVPADSSTEWMMNLDNQITYKEFAAGVGFEKAYGIFLGYLKDEIALAKDASNRTKLKNVGGKANQLRFFKDILSSELVVKVQELIDNKQVTEKDINDFIETNTPALYKSITDSITGTVDKTIDGLVSNNKVIVTKEGYAFPGLMDKFAQAAGLNKMELTDMQLMDVIKFVNTNYMINNIEFHKILFGDPYQFEIKKGKLDETKRIKSFLSPRRITPDFEGLNNWLNNTYNVAGNIILEPGEIGYHEHKSYAKTFTAADVEVVNGFYPKANEADAASWIIDGAYREVKIRNGQWSDEAEAFHQWQMAYARLNIPGYKYKNEALRKQDESITAQPMPKFTLEVLKPIVSGNKFNKNNFDLVLDKFSQMPIYYQAVEGTNLEKLYLQMFDQGYDYAVVESGRKVGTEELHDLYTADGNFNTEAFNNTIDVPWTAYGIQVENSYEKDKQQTRGSQLTKLATVDLYKNGKAISEDANKAAQHNKAILEAMFDNGYKELTNRLGIQDLGDNFVVKDKATVANALKEEMLRREMSENGIDSISINPKTGEFYIPLEASTSYMRIKSMLYSMVDKAIVSPKVSGFSGVQVPVTGWEKLNSSRGADKTKSALKFYTKSEPYMEVFLPAWFRNKLPKGKFKNDEAIIEYFNNTDVLRGIGFRIPTQALSSVEVFKVKGFLPDYMGKTVVVPSEITTKAGSDFDIDKLNMYLKNIYVTSSGEIKSVPFFGFGQEAKDKIKKFILEEDIKAMLDLNNDISGDRTDDYGELADKLYKQSLENEYFRSLETLMTLPENFDRLTSANTDADLKTIATKLDKLKGESEVEADNKLLDRNYMTALRQAFVTGKRWVGIAAVNITGHSLTQKEEIYGKIADMNLPLDSNTIEIDGKKYISFSGDKHAGNEMYISDSLSMYANAFVDVAKDPYILKVIGSNRVVGIFMMMDRIGVPLEDAAMFMNQPIIKEYITYLDGKDAGRSAIYDDKNLTNIKNLFPTTADLLKDTKIDKANFENNISDYYTKKEKLTPAQNAEQHKILDVLLRYSALADANFEITQAINYDTTSFKNADDLGRKQLKTKLAERDNLISSPSKILNSSFLKSLERALDRSTDALGAILKFNTPEFRGVIENAIQQYAGNVYLSNDKFTQVAEKLSASFLDYIIQTKIKNPLNIKGLSEGTDSIAKQLAAAKQKYPNVKILQDLVIDSSGGQDSPKTVKLRANLKEAYDENLYIGMMRELRDNPDTRDLYNNLVKVALIQGTYQSAVSIKNVVPIEDYAELVTPIVSTVVVDEDIKNFAKDNWFERNNWNDENVTPRITPYINEEETTIAGEFNDDIISQYHFSGFVGIPSLNIEEANKMVIVRSRYGKGSNNDVIIIPAILDIEGEMVEFTTGRTITKAQYAIRKSKGDPTLTQVFGYQKVKYKDGTPLTNYKGNYVYKMINLHGDGQFASEYYVNPVPSVLNNNTIKPEIEIPNEEIIKHFDGTGEEDVTLPDNKNKEDNTACEGGLAI